MASAGKPPPRPDHRPESAGPVRPAGLARGDLADGGYAVSVICPKAKGYTASFERLEGVDIYRYALPIAAQGAVGFVMEFAWCFLRAFMKSVRVAVVGRGFDVIHACNPPETYWLSLGSGACSSVSACSTIICRPRCTPPSSAVMRADVHGAAVPRAHDLPGPPTW